MPMRMTPGNAQHIGQRSSQQDAFGFSDTEDEAFTDQAGVLAVLADGMGGLAYGAEASRLAVQTIIQTYGELALEQSIPVALDTAIKAADEAVALLAESRHESGNVGTTVVAVVVRAGQLFWRSAGDSRLYLWRKPYLSQVTADHDYGRVLDSDVEAGWLSREEARNNPQRRALTSFVGQGPLSAIDANRRPFTLQAGDQLLLCSDGLYNSLATRRMIEVLEYSLDPHVAAESLVEHALAQGLPRQDNVTALVMAFEDGAVTVSRKTGPRQPGLLQRLCGAWKCRVNSGQSLKP